MYNFALSESLTCLIDFPTRILDYDDQSSSHLDLFLASNPDVCKICHDSPLGGSDPVVVLFDISLNCSAAKKSPIPCAIFIHDLGDWDNCHDFLHVVLWMDTFAKLAETWAEEVTSQISIGINTFISSHKYQLKPYSSSWFSPACVAAITHHNNLFRKFQRGNSTINKHLFTNVGNQYRIVIHDAKSDNEQHIRGCISSQNISSHEFWRIIKHVSGNTKPSIQQTWDLDNILR